MSEHLSFPVRVRMPHGDGPLTITNVAAGTSMRFVVERDHTEATTRDRLDALLRAGGVIAPDSPRQDGRGSAGNGDTPRTPNPGPAPTNPKGR